MAKTEGGGHTAPVTSNLIVAVAVLALTPTAIHAAGPAIHAAGPATHADPATHAGPATQSSRAAQARNRTQDLDAFETGYLAVDRSLQQPARARADAMLTDLRDRAASGGLSDAEFELAIAEIAALSDNGHSGILIGRWSADFDRLAVRFLVADDGLFIADAGTPHDDLVGRRVAAIEGHDLAALRAAWARYYPRTDSGRDDVLHLFLESPALLHAAGLIAAPGAVTLALADGRTVAIGLGDRAPTSRGIEHWLPPSRLVELTRAKRIGADPLYLQEPDATFRFVELPERDAVYLQFRANHYFGPGDLRGEAARAIARLRDIAPRYVIVDQRFNFGGDLNNTRDLMQAIPEIVGASGRIAVIVSGRTFSAGIASVGYLKQAGGERVAIVGAPVGDHLEFWAEGQPIALPGSGTLIGVSTERHNYVTGCQETDCHGSIRNHPIRVESLTPDVQPKFTYDDVVSGRDPYLDAAFEVVSNPVGTSPGS